MLSRFLEKRIEIELQEIPHNTGNPLELEYYLIECDPDGDSNRSEEKCYGIQIVKKESDRACESITYKDIYPCRATTEKLVRLLAENTVTPVSLPYILDDILGC